MLVVGLVQRDRVVVFLDDPQRFEHIDPIIDLPLNVLELGVVTMKLKVVVEAGRQLLAGGLRHLGDLVDQ